MQAPSPDHWRQLRPRHVIIWQRKGGDYVHEHKPYFDEGLIRTLELGFEAAQGINVTRGFFHSSQRNSPRSVPKGIGAGDIFIFVGMFTREIGWSQMGHLGVRRVFFQTEPVDNCSSPAGLPIERRALIVEIWDFSEHNLEKCRILPYRPVLRHVPLGYIEGAAQASKPRNGTGPLFFFGNHLEPGRRRCCRALRLQLRAHNFVHRFDVFNDASFVSKVLNNYNVFVNIHKVCGDPHSPVTFRAAKILNAGKLLISERAHPHDEKQYDGVILFVDNITAAYRRIVADGDWQARAAVGVAAFRRRFQPVDLFERAGIYADFGLRRDQFGRFT